MRIKIMIILSIFILGVFNYSIYENESIKKHGEIILLKFIPYDPRSIMQGDYMALHYKIAADLLNQKKIDSIENNQYIVIQPDKNNVGQFVRFYKKESLTTGEKLLRINKKYNSVTIIPDSFLFQEGHAKYYSNAEYAIFKFDNSGKYLLVGLADKNRKTIIIP